MILPTLDRLIASADAVIETHAPGALAAQGVDLDAAIERQPSLVVTSITPYGQDGPRAHWRATSLTAAAAGDRVGGSVACQAVSESGPDHILEVRQRVCAVAAGTATPRQARRDA